MKKLFSTSEAADLLGISRIAVFKRIKKGQIKAKKVGRTYVIDPNENASVFAEQKGSIDKEAIDTAVTKVVDNYGEALRLLGAE